MHFCGQTRPYKEQVDKTIWSLILGEEKREEEERRREEVEEEEERKPRKVWKLGICMEMYGFL